MGKLSKVAKKIADAILIKEDFDDDYDEDDEYIKELEEKAKRNKKNSEKEVKNRSSNNSDKKKSFSNRNNDDKPTLKFTRGGKNSSKSDVVKSSKEASRNSFNQKSTYSNSYFPRKLKDAREYDRGYSEEKPVKRRSSSRVNDDYSQINLFKVRNFADAQYVCDMILDGNAIIVDFGGIDGALAQRIMDFIVGCLYSIEGNINSISNTVYLFSPENVDISGEYINMLKKDSYGMPLYNK